MKYTYTCGMDNYVMSVEAQDDNEAVRKIKELGRKHIKESHANAAPMTDQEFEKDIRAHWKKA
jgi:hypothetical protein